MSAELLLSRLSKVRPRGPAQWSAQCPSHEDKGPSLSVKELADGRVLVHCFAGCGVDEVVGSLGLDIGDLFPPKDVRGAPAKPRRLIGASQALELIHDETQVVALVASDIARGEQISQIDCNRVLVAAGRIAYLLEEVRS